MGSFITIKESLEMGSYLYPDKISARDFNRVLTYKELNERCCRLANSLLDLGLKKGDRISIIAYNCLEWVEIYGAAAKAGLVAVPIMFRLVPDEYKYILENSGSSAFIMSSEFAEGAETIRNELPKTLASNYICFGEKKPQYSSYYYEDMMENGSISEPNIDVSPKDTWVIIYTSGTTGKPKGVVRTHECNVFHYLMYHVEMGLGRDDVALLVMPMAHGNSFLYCFEFLYCYCSIFIYSKKSFNPELVLKTMEEGNITFTSLVPTQYVMILSLPDEIKNKYDVSHVRALLCSSAPVRKSTKAEIMNFFKNASLYEGYGSTEAAIPIMLRPEDQFRKLGSIGREMIGVSRSKVLDENGQEVPVGGIGEMYTKEPSTFKEYWNAPDKTQEAFRENHFSAGDMAYRDEEGFYYLVDRKKNMIITGGENVYPSEVEEVVISYPAVKEVLVIGIPDKKWGETIKAVVVLEEGIEGDEKLKAQILEYCKNKMAGYKRPRSIDFVKFDEIPRNAVGKFDYGALRDKYGRWSDSNE